MKLNFLLPISAITILAIGGGYGALGCKEKVVGGKVIERFDELKPDANLEPAAVLVLAGTEIPVTIEGSRNGDLLTLRLVSAHDAELEQEQYLVTGSSFELTQAAGEFYRPPLTLLKFPLKLNASSPWKGQLVIGESARNASATITASPSQLADLSEAVKVEVALQIESGGAKPAQRQLSFWFSPTQGLVQREFGAGSTRRPGKP